MDSLSDSCLSAIDSVEHEPYMPSDISSLDEYDKMSHVTQSLDSDGEPPGLCTQVQLGFKSGQNLCIFTK